MAMKTHECPLNSGDSVFETSRRIPCSRRRLLAWLFCTLAMLMLSQRSKAIDLSETFPVERYTILSDTSFLSESGRLLRSGRFQVFSSVTLPMPLFADREELEPISGRTVVNSTIYDGAEAAGVIPRWVRSVFTYPVGPVNFVIVSVRGGPDPNPTPWFEFQPANETVLAGEQIFLTGWAQPENDVSYQWLKNGKPIAGETFFFLSIDSASLRDAGRYTLQASIGTAESVSQAAVVRVIQPVTIRRDLRDVSVKTGRSVALRAVAKGTGPLHYQWYRNDEPIPGATKPRLLIRPATDAEAGAYWVVIQNDLSVAESLHITITVTP
jgi:hypothetical protein